MPINSEFLTPNVQLIFVTVVSCWHSCKWGLASHNSPCDAPCSDVCAGEVGVRQLPPDPPPPGRDPRPTVEQSSGPVAWCQRHWTAGGSLFGGTPCNLWAQQQVLVPCTWEVSVKTTDFTGTVKISQKICPWAMNLSNSSKKGMEYFQDLIVSQRYSYLMCINLAL